MKRYNYFYLNGPSAYGVPKTANDAIRIAYREQEYYLENDALYYNNRNREQILDLVWLRFSQAISGGIVAQ